MELVVVECPSCGATLPPAEPAGGYVCAYCGERFEIGRAKGAKTTAGKELSVAALAKELYRMQQAAAASKQRAAEQQARKAATSATRVVVPVMVLGAVVTVLGVLLPVFMMSSDMGGVMNKITDKVGDKASLLSPLLWDDVGGLPEPVVIGGAPAVVGRTRTVVPKDALYIDAYDLGSGERLWRVGELGPYGTGYQATLFGVVGDRVLISDAEARLHFHDLQSGARQKTVALTDKVSYICTPSLAARSRGVLPPAPEEDAGKAWVEQIDKRAFLVDVAAGTLTEAERPAWCTRGAHQAKELGAGGPIRRLPRGHKGSYKPPKLKGLAIQRTFVDGDDVLAVAVKKPGTPIPFALRLPGGAKEPLWKVDVADVPPASIRGGKLVAGVGGGRFVVVYGTGQDEWRMAAFDTSSGDRQWGRGLKPVFSVDNVGSVTVTPTYVVLVHSTALEIFRADTGEPVRVIGSIQYD